MSSPFLYRLRVNWSKDGKRDQTVIHKSIKCLLTTVFLLCAQINIRTNKDSARFVVPHDVSRRFRTRRDIRFQRGGEGPCSASRSYSGFTATANEEERSRVYGGIRFTFYNVAGQSIGLNVASYVFLAFHATASMRPVGIPLASNYDEQLPRGEHTPSHLRFNDKENRRVKKGALELWLQ